MRGRRARRTGATAVGCALALCCGDADANAGRPWDPGDPLAEPIARIREVSISSEQLVIDARAFAEGGAARITATYRVFCSATEGVRVPLVFVSPGIENGAVTLDGQALTHEALGMDALPEAWRSPDTTPDGLGEHLKYAVPIARVLVFTAEFARGDHELKVRYQARPALHHDSTLVAMQLAYVLSPARDWGSFGGLDVEVLAPDKWTLRVEPALKRDATGSRWSLHFDDIPANALSMTFRPSRPFLRELIPWFVFGLALLVSTSGGSRAGKSIGRRFSGAWPALAGGFASATGGAMVVMGAWYIGLAAMRATLPSALLSDDRDYAALGIAAFGLFLGFVITGAAFAWSRSRVPVGVS